MRIFSNRFIDRVVWLYGSDDCGFRKSNERQGQLLRRCVHWRRNAVVIRVK
jgi:hypothetical protein